MKHIRKLTLRQKKFLSEQGMKPDEYYYIKRTPNDYVFFNKKTGQVVYVRR